MSLSVNGSQTHFCELQALAREYKIDVLPFTQIHNNLPVDATTWCSEIDDYIKRITPEAEEKDLVLKDGCNMILSAGRHSEEGHNATMRNPATFKYRQPYTLAMNPEDGKKMGIADGQMVRVSTNTGSLEIPVEYTWQTARGYVLIPHHFGYKFEGKTYGVHVNLLTSHKDLDELTGNPIWRYTPCRVEAI